MNELKECDMLIDADWQKNKIDSNACEDIGAGSMNELKYQVITDEEIVDLFSRTCFGETIDASVIIQRKEICKWLENKRDHYWVGHTAFFMLVSAGLVNNNLPVQECIPTARGFNFIQQELENSQVR